MKGILAIFAGLALLPGPAGAAGLEAEYTDVDFGQCTIIEADDTGAAYACPGLRGYPVMIAEGDLRMFVSFGLNPGAERAAEQTLPPFNHLGTKMEWRVDASDPEDRQPRATILRWFVEGDEAVGRPAGEVLVVTQIKPGATCHMAYVDASAMKDANAAARKIADGAGRFDCAEEPELVAPFRAW